MSRPAACASPGRLRICLGSYIALCSAINQLFDGHHNSVNTLNKTPEPGTLSERGEEIVAVATRLFAECGFHGVSTREIAAACGLNVATVNHHVGGKRALYLRVLHRLYAEDQALLEGLVSRLDPEVPHDAVRLRDLLLEQIDTLVDETRRNPLRVRLYVRRWLEARDELSAMESELSLGLYRPLLELLSAAREAGTIRLGYEPSLFLRSFDWLIYSYFVSGPMERDRLRGDPENAEHLKTFRLYLREYTCRMLGLPAAD
jgi:AcrR family transcriptional regulator